MGVVRFSLKLARYSAIRAAAALDFIFSRSNNLVFSTKVFQDDRMQNKFFIYAAWTKSGMPSDSDKVIIKSFMSSGYQVLVSLNVDKKNKFSEIQQEIFKAWGEFCSILLVRQNLGRDLAAYRDAMRFLNESHRDVRKLVFANNSILWLPNKMDTFVREIDQNSNAVFTATESFQPFEHGQSFVLGASAEGKVALELALHKIRNTRLRSSAVIHGELKIARVLTRLMHQPVPIYSYERLIRSALTSITSEERWNGFGEFRFVRANRLLASEAHGQANNPTHFLWLELYELGFPGLKLDLITKNPSRIPDVPLVENFIEIEDRNAFPSQILLSSFGYRKKLRAKKLFGAKSSPGSN